MENNADLEPSHGNLYTDQQLLDDLRRVADSLGTRRLSQPDYDRLGRYSTPTITRRFMTWVAALSRVNLKPAYFRNAGAAVVLDDIRRVAGELQIKRLRLDQYLARGNYGRGVIMRLFGVWYRAVESAGLESFAHYETRTQGPRSISLTLRHQVLSRDQFRCCHCGRSPATHPKLHLQVDHKIPWSRGGKTVMENLQTLCNQCNRGKADLMEEPPM